jgi:hypothetical protein
LEVTSCSSTNPESSAGVLLLQHQAYAACGDEGVRPRVRACYDRLVAHVKALSGADDERVDEFFRYGMWINVQAALRAHGVASRERPPGCCPPGRRLARLERTADGLKRTPRRGILGT